MDRKSLLFNVVDFLIFLVLFIVAISILSLVVNELKSRVIVEGLERSESIDAKLIVLSQFHSVHDMYNLIEICKMADGSEPVDGSSYGFDNVLFIPLESPLSKDKKGAIFPCETRKGIKYLLITPKPYIS